MTIAKPNAHLSSPSTLRFPFFVFLYSHTQTHTSTIYILTITWWKWKCRAENKIYSNSSRTYDSMTIFFSELKQFFCCLLTVYAQHCCAHEWMFKCLFHSCFARVQATVAAAATTSSKQIDENIFIQSGCLLPLFRANNKCRFHVRSSSRVRVLAPTHI